MLTERQQDILMQALRTSGLFVTTGLEHPNVMSTHWGTFGYMWNKHVFLLPVRKSKFSHDLIDEHKSFALSIPIKDMRAEIIACDHLSGYKVNKFDELHLHPKKAKSIPTYILSECGLIVECKVIFSADMYRSQLDDQLADEMYNSKDFHTMYFGEIVNVYEN